jgi:hypothetical protein
VVVRHGGAEFLVATKAVICASGGFEANLEWLRRYWGDGVDNYIIRGTPYNDGHVLDRLCGVKAASAGQTTGFHAIAVDARALRFDGGISTRLDTIPFGLVLNKHVSASTARVKRSGPSAPPYGARTSPQDDQITILPGNQGGWAVPTTDVPGLDRR